MGGVDLQLERIRELIALMRETGVSELALEIPDFKLSVKREAAPWDEADVDQPVAAPRERAASAAEPVAVTAPMVGIFRASTDHSAAVAVGDVVSAGQVLGAIEAMKVLTDIPSPVSGVVREVAAQDGAPVEYGQPLLLIEPALAPEGEQVEAEAL